MVRHFKKELILSSLLILLPMVLGLLWGTRSQEDAFTGSAFPVSFLTLTLLLTHWLCLFITCKDPKNQGRNRKVFRLILWIMPLVSLYSNAILYCAASGHGLNMNMMAIVPIALMFVVIGNYLPKCQQNHTIGIKIPWTLANEENWNRTHRFGGKCWVIGGLSMILCVFLPENAGFLVLIAAIFILAFLPMAYSYRIYRQHQKQGILYPKIFLFGSRKAARISAVFLTVFLIFILVIMFTGDLTYSFGEDSFTIKADYYTDITVSYDSIDSVIYHPGNVPGTRTAGFGSARLLMGGFYSEEFGYHTRYSYTNPESCVIITRDEKRLVLSGADAAETEAIYQQLLEKMK